MLNRDLADEHAAIIRYLVHAWMEGEDTPIGASLLSRSREEMWHIHWLGMIIGQLGGEPDFNRRHTLMTLRTGRRYSDHMLSMRRN